MEIHLIVNMILMMHTNRQIGGMYLLQLIMLTKIYLLENMLFTEMLITFMIPMLTIVVKLEELDMIANQNYFIYQINLMVVNHYISIILQQVSVGLVQMYLLIIMDGPSHLQSNGKKLQKEKIPGNIHGKVIQFLLISQIIIILKLQQ